MHSVATITQLHHIRADLDLYSEAFRGESGEGAAELLGAFTAMTQRTA